MKRPASITILIFIVSVLVQCKKNDPVALTTPGKLYYNYKDGEIRECWIGGSLHYCARENAYDAMFQLFDKEGKSIVTCTYMFTNFPCNKIDSARIVYRCEDHISGEPFVDLYGLSKTYKKAWTVIIFSK